MNNNPNDTPMADAVVDLGPLAWVMDELERTLTGVVQAVRVYVVNNEAARATDLAQVDALELRMARQQLHQAVGALEMVNLPAAARTLRALEAATSRLEQRPALATPEVLPVFQKTAWVLTDFLQRHMAQRPVPGLALFPVYSACQRLAGAERTHPADLWAPTEPWVPAEPGPGKVYTPGPQVRAHLDRLVLLVVKSLHPEAAASLALLSAGLARGATDLRWRHFWMSAHAYFQLVAQGKTVVSVLHELTLALQADELVILAQGRVIHQGGVAAVPTHRALEGVFDQRIAVKALAGQHIALPRP